MLYQLLRDFTKIFSTWITTLNRQLSPTKTTYKKKIQFEAFKRIEYVVLQLSSFIAC